MSNISKSNRYNIKIDFEKSEKSYLFDKNRKKKLLDFFGMFSSLPLGYNHPIFGDEFKEEILRVAPIKINNCFISSEETLEFDDAFTAYAPEVFKHFYYCCTGSLAVEAAVKTAIEYLRSKSQVANPKVICFSNSFHGINGWGSFFTSREGNTKNRLEGYPQYCATVVKSPQGEDKDDQIRKALHDTEIEISTGNVAAILVEPMQSTFGDIYFSTELLVGLRYLCDQFDIPLIFDEVQTGFGASGKKWYYEHLRIMPDILIFGKKTQLSGIMVQEKFSTIFKQPYKKLEATWDATPTDMIRCKYIIKAYKEENLLDNATKMGSYLLEELNKIEGVLNPRGVGCLLAFDLETQELRDRFALRCIDNNLIVNTAEENTIRLRPNLNVSYNECTEALATIESAIQY